MDDFYLNDSHPADRVSSAWPIRTDPRVEVTTPEPPRDREAEQAAQQHAVAAMDVGLRNAGMVSREVLANREADARAKRIALARELAGLADRMPGSLQAMEREVAEATKRLDTATAALSEAEHQLEAAKAGIFDAEQVAAATGADADLDAVEEAHWQVKRGELRLTARKSAVEAATASVRDVQEQLAALRDRAATIPAAVAYIAAIDGAAKLAKSIAGKMPNLIASAVEQWRTSSVTSQARQFKTFEDVTGILTDAISGVLPD